MKEQELKAITELFQSTKTLMSKGVSKKDMIKNHGANSNIISILENNPYTDLELLANEYWEDNYSKVDQIKEIKESGCWFSSEGSRVKLEESIELHNERCREYNIANGLKVDFGFINQPQIGMKIYPIDEYKEGKVFNYKNYYDTCRISVSRMIDGNMIKLSPEWVKIICLVLGVDPNFLFGQPSEHDEDYKRLVTNKQK